MVGKNQIIEAIQEGVIKAQENYNEAASSPLFWAPEYLMDVHIFQSIFRCTGKDYLTLQHNIKDLKKNFSLHSVRGRQLKVLPEGARIDIIVWYPQKGIIRAFVEVKREAKDYKNDIDRINKLLKMGGRFGVFVSAIHKSYDSNIPTNRKDAEKELKSNLREIESDVKQLVEDYFGNSFTAKLFDRGCKIAEIPLAPEPEENKRWIWRPVCFLIERNN